MKRIIGSLGLITLCWLIGSCGDSPTGPPPPPPPPTTAVVVISATTSTLVPSQTLQLSATAKDIAGQVLSRTFSWTSSDQAKATVSSSGMVSGVAPGSATITASVDGKSATTSVTVLDGGVVSSVAMTLNLMSGGVQIIVPDSAVLTPINMSVVPSTAFATDPRVVKGTPYDFGPSGTTFAKPVTIKIKYDPANLPTGTEEAALQIHLSVPGWQPVETSTVDTAANVVTAQVSHFSTYAILTPLPVASVEIRAPPGQTIVGGVSTLVVGETEQLTAALADAQGQPLSNRAITWATTNASIATITSSGLVTAINPGSTTISATAGGVTSSITVTVTPIPVSSVAVALTPQTITVGQTSQAAAVLKDSKGSVLTGRSILWASDNAAVATINSATGVVTAVAPGSATISATSEGQSGTATITVTLVPVASVSVSLASNSISAVETTQATASLHDGNGGVLSGRTITWSSDNTAVATVSSTGLVTAVSTGTANISAVSEGKTGTTPVTVTPAPVASVTVAAPSGSLVEGSTFQLSAETRDANGRVITGRLVTWSTDAPGVATVSATGLVTAVAPGTAKITAESENKIGMATITVTAIPVATVNVLLAPSTVIAGQTTQATATTLDGSGNTLTGRIIVWSSDDASIATVSSTGLVTSHAAGTAHITATSETKTGSAQLTVNPVPVATVTVNPAAPSVIVGATQQLTATTKDAIGNALTGRAVTWSSSDNTIATVDQTGLVTAHAVGTATVSATSEGKIGSSSVTVTAVPVASITVSLNPNSITAVGTSQATAVTLDAHGAVLTGRTIAWSSTNTAVATVSVQGIVIAVVEGTANIVATSEGKTGSAVLTVTPAPVATVTVNPPSATVFQSATEQLTVVLKDSHNNVLSGRTVVWSSSNLAVATVSTNGLVTAASGTMGTATITATSEGQTGTSSITVSQVPVASVSVALTPSTINVGQNAQASATLRDASNNVLTGRTVIWTSDNTTVATVSSGGVVTALAAGTAHISGASGGQTGSATLTVTPIPVASVSVSLAASPIQVGQTTQATATTRDAGNNVLTGRVIAWSSDNSGIATVSTSGLVTAIAAGTANITAASEGQSGSSLLTVIPVPVVSVALSAPTTPMVLGQAQQLTAIPKDAGGNTLAGRTVNWVSSNPAVLSVSAPSSVSTLSGATINVTAAGLGTAIITASSESAPSVATPAITVNPIPVATVTVSPSSATLAIGVTSTQQLTATLKDSNNNILSGRTVTWTSSNPSAATVDPNGFVTAVGGGSTTITATSEGKTGTAAITVTVPVATVIVNPSSATLTVGLTHQLTATTKDVNGAVLTGRVVTWSSSDPTIASVSSTGMVTAVAAGTAVITATSEGKSGASSITVTPVPVDHVSASLSASTIQVGQTTQATATTFDASNNVLTGRVVIWSTGNQAVATVTSSGLVTAVGVGSTTITGTSEGKPGSASLTVIAVPVGSVTVTPGSATVIAGGTQQLTAETRDANNVVVTDRPVAWSSSNTAIASVSGTGLVTAVSVGGATITATSEGKSGTSSITVVPVPVASVTVALSPSSITAVGTSQATATTLDGNGGTLTGRVVTWSSNNSAVATVSAQGVVTAISVGTASITGTSEGKTGSATITVTPAPVASVTVSPTSAIVVQGGTEQLSVTLKDANGNVLTGRTVTWSSSSNPVATVTQGGLVTAVAVGTATITATSEGQSGTSSLTVSPIPVASVTVTLSSSTITDAQTTQATAVDKDADGNVLTGRTITWSSDNSAVATVSSFGVVTPVAAGSTQIRATSGGQTGSATLTVIPSVAAVIVSPPSAIVVIGTTLQLAAETRDASNNVLSGRTVTWSSDAPSIATVSASGLVTAVALGSATITATSEGKTGTSSITVVQVPVALVTVSLAPTTITVGQTTQASATTRDGNGNILTGRSIVWSSGNNSIATVSSTGLVTSVSAGSVQIIAMSEGKTGSATLTVNPAPVATVALSVLTTPMIVGGTQVLAATPKDAGGNTLSGRTVNWTSSNPAVLSVSSASSVSTASGATVTVTAVGTGTATITATSELAPSATTPLITVNPVPVATVTVTPATTSLVLGITPTQQLAAVTKDIDGNVLAGRVVTWTSSNPTAATVDANGLVTAVGAGGTTITATSETKIGTATITVTLAPVNTVTVTPSSASLVLGVTPTQQLTAVTKDANGNVLTGRTVTWSSSNNAVATVSTTGLVTAVAAGGPVTITATSETKTGTSSVTVALAPVNTVTVNPPSASLVLGIAPTQQLTATLRDVANNVLTGRVVTYSSSNSAVASVDGNGLVTAVAAGGPVTITATSETKTGTSSITVTLAPVNAVTLSAPTTPMLVGATQVLTAVPKDANNNILSGRTVNWTSSNPSILSVSSATSVSTSTGATVTLTAVTQGTATITATSESAPSATTPVITVNPVPVATVTVAPASASLVIGITPTQQLTATLRDGANNILTGRVVTWSSSNQAAATVDANGLVTALGAGTTTITATSETKTGTSSITVSLAPVNIVTVSPSSASLVVGITPTQQLTATLRDAANNVLTGRTVIWASSDQTVATVDANGLVTAVTAGSATITATSETKTGTSSITVTLAPVNTVTVTPPSASLVVGITPTQQLTAVTKDANGAVLTGRLVTWASSNTSAATVDANGLVTAVGAGSATITATSETKTGTSSITVTLAPVNTVTVAPLTATLVLGITPTQQLTTTLRDAANNVLTGRVVMWTSSNQAAATVDANGLVTAVGAGTTTITATSETKTGTSVITVTVAPVNAVTVTPPTATLVLGVTPTQQLTANLTDANGNPLNGRTVGWTSSNTAAATVDANGLVTAVAAGTSTITATSETRTGTSSITVTLAPVNTVTVTPSSASLVLGITPTQQLTATLTDANNNVLTGRVITWSSSNLAAATVDANGLVTAVGAGSTTVTATSETKTGTSSITVTLAPVNTVTVTPSSASLVVGITPTQQLMATLTDVNSNVLTGRVVTWTSSNLAAATVDGNGLVTAVGAGSATITATSETKTGTSSLIVTLAPVVTVTISAPTTAMVVGGTQQLTATLKDANNNTLTGRTVSWVSSNTAVLTVSPASGATGTTTVTAMGVGTATITATSESVSSLPTPTITVTLAPVATVTVSAPTTPMVVGGTQQLTATLKDANNITLTGRTVSWVSSNTAVLTVSPASGTNGTTTVTAVGVGTATITATSESVSSSPTPTITVNLPPATLLHVSASNRRYFENATGQIVYLTGSHTWSNLQDNGTVDPPPTFDYSTYLDFLATHHHNFFRLWAWEQSKWTAEITSDYWITPGPFLRTGPDTALDGKPKFDVSQFNQAYFDRLRSRVQDAGARGIYASVMLFDGWSVATKGGLADNNPWKGHPFNAANNINGIDGDPNHTGLGLESQTLDIAAVTAIQEAYVRKVIDAVGDLDNVLYEIDNEGDPSSRDWQYHMIQVIRDYEATKPKQHPIGMTPMWPGGVQSDLIASGADWIAAGEGDPENPSTADGTKVLISDTDHICGICGSTSWVWKAFAKGQNPILMDGYDGAAIGLGAEDYNVSDPKWELIRKNMGYARDYALRLDLKSAVPHGDLVASEPTGYCLAKPGSQYLVYLPNGGSVTLNLSAVTGTLNVEWLNPATGVITQAGTVSGGPSVTVPGAPFSGPSVLFIH